MPRALVHEDHWGNKEEGTMRDKSTHDKSNTIPGIRKLGKKRANAEDSHSNIERRPSYD